MYFRLSIGGSIGSYEVWSINPVFDPTAEVENTWVQASGQAMVDAAAAVVPTTSMRALLGPIANQGRYRLEARHNVTDELLGFAEKVLSSPHIGTGAQNVKTMQTAVVLSLRTSTPGARGRGRLYYPAFGANVNDSFRLSAPAPTALLADFKSYLESVRSAMLTASGPGWPFLGLNLAVRSKANSTTPHVVQLQLGDILDVQRRRRDRIPESYVVTPVP